MTAPAASRHGYEITSEEEKKLSTLFNQLDVNKDGRIDVDDLSQALETMQVPQAPGHVQEFFRKHDQDRDGQIDFAEFVRYVTEHEQKLKLYFKKIDTNSDGVIDVSEIRESFKKLGVNIDQAEAEKLLKRMDKDGTLKVDWDEWRNYLIMSPSQNLTDILHFWRHASIIDVGDNTLIPDDFTEEEMKTGMWWRHLVAGGSAGAVSRTATAPLDRLKVLMQVHGGAPKVKVHGSSAKANVGVVSSFQYMLKEGGVKSLWRGNGINVIKIAPESALKFMAYEQIKKIVKGDRTEIGIGVRLLSGSLAGATAQTIIYPMEVLKTRLALRATGQYNGIADCAMKVYKKEGFKAFYRGYIPNIIGIIPYAGIDLAIYETLKLFYMKKYNQQDPSILVLLVCGTTSSSCGQLASYPLALVRTRLQADKTHQSTMTGLFTKIIREDGFKGLYRGITPNFLKVAPAVSISYVVYEKVRQMLGIKS